jgi:hypothetical protein
MYHNLHFKKCLINEFSIKFKGSKKDEKQINEPYHPYGKLYLAKALQPLTKGVSRCNSYSIKDYFTSGHTKIR